MKRFLALLLVLAVVLALCACGESADNPEPTEATEESASPAARQLEEQIYALGEISLDSKDAIEAAEAAYEALSAVEKEQVRNIAILQAARFSYDCLLQQQAAEEDKTALLAGREAFAGTWVPECPVRSYREFTLFADTLTLDEDGTFKTDYRTGNWSYNAEDNMLEIGETRWFIFEEDGFTKIRVDSHLNSHAYVRDQDLEAAREKKYVEVELTPDNLREYIGDPISLGYEFGMDKFNEFDQSIFHYFFPSPAYERGLVLIGESGVRVEVISEKGEYFFVTPGAIQRSASPLRFTGRAQGTLYFVRDSYVEQNHLGHSSMDTYNCIRYLVFTDGETFDKAFYDEELILTGGYVDQIDMYENNKY